MRFRYNKRMLELYTGQIAVQVFRREGPRMLYLMLHRPPQTNFAGQWQLMFGDMAQGEHPLTTLIRTVREQIGLEVFHAWALDYTLSYYLPQTNRLHLTPVFAAEISPGPIHAHPDHDDSRTVTCEQGIALLRVPGQREALQRIHNEIVQAPDRGLPFRMTADG